LFSTINEANVSLMRVKHLAAHCSTRFRIFMCGISIDEIRDELFSDSWKIAGFRYGSRMVIELIEAMQLAGASDANLSIETPMAANISARTAADPAECPWPAWLDTGIN